MRADRPKNVIRGAVCAYIRESLSVHNFSNLYLSECLTLEVAINNKKSYAITSYRFPAETSDEFHFFIRNLEKLLINITSYELHHVIILVNFNANSKPGQLMTQQQRKVQYWKT